MSLMESIEFIQTSTQLEMHCLHHSLCIDANSPVHPFNCTTFVSISIRVGNITIPFFSPPFDNDLNPFVAPSCVPLNETWTLLGLLSLLARNPDMIQAILQDDVDVDDDRVLLHDKEEEEGSGDGGGDDDDESPFLIMLLLSLLSSLLVLLFALAMLLGELERGYNVFQDSLNSFPTMIDIKREMVD
ncbi:hypothetical protein BDC45DRAFT_538548 [Circinella umbellata]|nr:hypothetical protein BDC45DRAFT_538548 [Circinella umbellata]